MWRDSIGPMLTGSPSNPRQGQLVDALATTFEVLVGLKTIARTVIGRFAVTMPSEIGSGSITSGQECSATSGRAIDPGRPDLSSQPAMSPISIELAARAKKRHIV
jgi:hypothetical protein